jgi:Winged helix DNA-binding domain
VIEVTWPQVLAWRMRRQSLVPRADDAVADIVRRCAGIQAQVHSAAVLAVAQRRRSPKPGEVDRALWDERSIVKTWAMRGTLHLIAADELPTVVAVMRTLDPWSRPSWEKYFGVTRDEVERIRDTIGEVLEGRVLTREELGGEVSERLRSKRVAELLRSGWGMLLKPAAYAGLLIQGPPTGRNVTYTRPDGWLGTWSEPHPIEAGAALLRSYLHAHGPARMQDVAAWWARQSPGRVRPWFDALSDELAEVDVEGRPSWMLASDVPSLRRQRPNDEVRLLPAFDQYVIAAARDIDALVPPSRRKDVSRTAGWISPTIVRGGAVVGTWFPSSDGSIDLRRWDRRTKVPDDEVRRVQRLDAAALDEAELDPD